MSDPREEGGETGWPRRDNTAAARFTANSIISHCKIERTESTMEIECSVQRILTPKAEVPFVASCVSRAGVRTWWTFAQYSPAPEAYPGCSAGSAKQLGQDSSSANREHVQHRTTQTQSAALERNSTLKRWFLSRSLASSSCNKHTSRDGPKKNRQQGCSAHLDFGYVLREGSNLLLLRTDLTLEPPLLGQLLMQCLLPSEARRR